jgi:hypothetical protein
MLAYKNSDIHRAGQGNKSLNMFGTNSVAALLTQFFNHSEMALKVVLVYQVEPLHVLSIKV